MDGEILDAVREWGTRPVADGIAGLHDLADEGFSGAVTDGSAWAFVLNGRYVGVFDGDVEDFEDSDLTAHTAPDRALPLLYAMQARGGETRGQYYSNETPLTEIDETLSAGNFVGYVELSENVLSGDYYVVYYGGRSLPVAFVGNSRRLLTGDEAFERAADEVGIYSIVVADVAVTELPPRPTPPSDDEGDAAAVGGAAAAGTSPPSDAAADTEDVGFGAQTDRADATDAGATDATDATDAEATDTTDATDAGATDATDATDTDELGDATDATDTDELGDATDATDGEATDADELGDATPDWTPPDLAGTDEDGDDPRAVSDATAEAADDQHGMAETSDAPSGGDDAPSGGDDAPSGGDDVASVSDAEAEEDAAAAEGDDRVVGDGATVTTEDVAMAASGAEAGDPAADRDGDATATSAGGDASATADEAGPRPHEPGGAPSATTATDAAADRDATDPGPEVERLRDRIAELEAEIERLEDADAAVGDEAASERTLSPDAVRSGTHLFVRYEDKTAGTVDDAVAGRIDESTFRSNLRLDYHTQFETAGAAVEGQPFESYLRETPEHRFVEWLLTSALFELQRADERSSVSKLYDAIDRLDRIDLNGEVDVGGGTAADAAEPTSVSFDVVFRDRMGDPVFVADLEDSRDPTAGSAVESLLEGARRVSRATQSFAAAFLVTTSFFDAGAMEAAVDATRGGLFSRSSRRSYVKLSRKSGFHLCLVEARDEDFFLTVPDV
jgi:hypothetical protein